MKRFIVKLISILVIFIFAYIPSFYIVDFLMNNINDNNSIYIVGDSQTERGINIELLKRATGKNVLTASKAGVSPYDIIHFIHQIPSNAIVIIGYPNAVQVRLPKRDRNDSGFSLYALLELYKADYGIAECLSIVKRNWKPRKQFTNSSQMLPVSNKVVEKRNFNTWIQQFSTVPDYVPKKQTVLLEAFDQLHKKNANVLLVSFPYHYKLDSLIKFSPVNDAVSNFKQSLLSKWTDKVEINTQIRYEQNIMQDYTHLNERGATLATQIIIAELKQLKQGQIRYIEFEPPIH